MLGFRVIAVAIAVALAGGMLAAPGASAAPSVTAHGSARQVYATGLPPRARAVLVNRHGRTVARERVDAQGGLLFRHIHPGSGYRVRMRRTHATSPPVQVHSNRAAPWDPGVYDQSIPAHGYTYLTTRDGTKLAIDVHPPTSPATLPGLGLGKLGKLGALVGPLLPKSAPYPTLIEYSGYGYADPSGPQNGIAVIANLLGFAVVDVNMRGTGCSGGAYNFFEPLQNLDGYDVIETIAHQPWVLGHRVGMMGISYGAISQLFTAQLDPPDLAAISPLSTIDATATTLYPGGILNTGFAVAWAGERQADAKPAGPHSGQSYAYQRIQQGDQTCKANQALHGEAVSLPRKIRRNAHFRPKVANPLDPVSFVHKIDVPTFMACQWEDEQTGGHCPDLAEHFTGTKLKWFTFTNGAHIDSLDPATLNRWYDFLELFVAHRPPSLNQLLPRAIAPIIYDQAMGIDDLTPLATLPGDPIQAKPTYQSALAAFEALPEIRVRFDNGAGKAPTGKLTPGDPYAGFERSFSRFPIPGTTARFFYLHPGGALGPRPPARRHIDRYTSDAKALPAADYQGNTGSGGLWAQASGWTYDWQQSPPGTAVSYVSPPLASDTAVIGGGAVHLWMKSSRPDA